MRIVYHIGNSRTYSKVFCETFEEAKETADRLFNEFKALCVSEMKTEFPTCHNFEFEKFDDNGSYGYDIKTDLADFSTNTKGHIIFIL